MTVHRFFHVVVVVAKRSIIADLRIDLDDVRDEMRGPVVAAGRRESFVPRLLVSWGTEVECL